MWKDLKSKLKVLTALKQNRISDKTSASDGVEKARKRIYRQATLTGLTILLTVLILFAMTSAWYTNVVQTSGLTFEAEAWGFEGEITVDESAILAAPGDDGIIDLTVQNESDSVSAISVNVAKNGMSEEMEKRLFFYVDTRMSRSGETMERVYLNRYEGYTYNVFNNSKLTLTKEFSNAPVIKWEWVYDVLGYYVLGKPYDITPNIAGENGEEATDTEGTQTTKQEMHVLEYLRPIIYDFDEATTLINKDDGNLTVELDTIDGVNTPVEFLAELSGTDGYPGTIDAESAAPVFENYYAIEVDEEGYGVYAYLCNYSEIQDAINYDTKLGEVAYRNAKGEELKPEEEALLKHSAMLTLSAQKDDNTVLTVSTLGALQDAILADAADVIQLTGNVTLDTGTSLLIPQNRRVMVDLNGKTLSNTDGTAITAMQGSSLTLTNGTLQQLEPDGTTVSGTYGVRATGAEVVMSDVTINDFQMGVYVGDNVDNNELDSQIHIMDSTISASNCAVFISGNGLLSEQKSRLIIEKSKLYCTNIVVSGNGDANGNGRWGTDIQIIDSKIIGEVDPEDSSLKSVGIYQPQKNSTLTIVNSQVTGYTGMALKGGLAKLINTTVVGYGDHKEPAFEGSGFTDTGDAVYVETSYGYEIQLLISGDESSLEHAHDESLSLRVFEEDADHVLIEVEGGIFDDELPEEYLAENCTQEQIKDTPNEDEPNDNVGRYRVVASQQSEETTGE